MTWHFCPRRSPERASKGKGKGWSVGTESVFEELENGQSMNMVCFIFRVWCDFGRNMNLSFNIVIFSVMVIVMMSKPIGGQDLIWLLVSHYIYIYIHMFIFSPVVGCVQFLGTPYHPAGEVDTWRAEFEEVSHWVEICQTSQDERSLINIGMCCDCSTCIQFFVWRLSIGMVLFAY